MPGQLFIISAPSGAGKTTLCSFVQDHFPDMLYSISFTTRDPRPGEKNGIDYNFISQKEFKDGIDEGLWVEWAEVHGNFYGTSAEFLDVNLSSGKNVLLDIDVQGAEQIIKRYPKSITIFIMPPSLKILRIRLENRGSDSVEVIEKRIKNAENEIKRKDFYQYTIINDQLPAATEELISIIEKHRAV